MTEETKKRIADAVVADLFLTGCDQPAERLVLEGKDKRDLGGWCRGAVRDRVLAILERSM